MAQQWFVYPVENGVELVVDSADGNVYDAALAAFVEIYTDYNVAGEWSVAGGEVITFVPAPDTVDVPAVSDPAVPGPDVEPADAAVDVA